MKKIIGLTIAALLIIGIVGAGTFAYFGDTETSTSNTFTAGTLNLVATTNGTSSTAHIVVTAGGDGINGNVVFTKLKPGDSGTMTWTLTNDGDLPGTLTIPSTVVFNDNNGSQKNPETKAIATNAGVNLGLGDLMGVWLTRGGTDILGTTAAYVPMSGLEAVLIAQSQSIAPTGSLVYVLHWAIPTDIPLVDDNIIQGDSATIDITFTLTQS